MKRKLAYLSHPFPPLGSAGVRFLDSPFISSLLNSHFLHCTRPRHHALLFRLRQTGERTESRTHANRDSGSKLYTVLFSELADWTLPGAVFGVLPLRISRNERAVGSRAFSFVVPVNWKSHASLVKSGLGNPNSAPTTNCDPNTPIVDTRNGNRTLSAFPQWRSPNRLPGIPGHQTIAVVDAPIR